MVDFQKLKHEWKTFALQLGSLGIGLHEAAIDAGADWTPFVPETYRPYVLPTVMTLSLALRRYTNKDTLKKDDTSA